MTMLNLNDFNEFSKTYNELTTKVRDIVEAMALIHEKYREKGLNLSFFEYNDTNYYFDRFQDYGAFDDNTITVICEDNRDVTQMFLDIPVQWLFNDDWQINYQKELNEKLVEQRQNEIDEIAEKERLELATKFEEYKKLRKLFENE